MRKQISTRIMTAALCCTILSGFLVGCQGNDNDAPASSQRNDNDAPATSTAPDIGENVKYQKSIDNYVEELEKRMKEGNVPSASLSISENGKTIYSKGFGYTNVDKKIPATPESLYFTGSVGKVYMTAAMLKLTQDQGISLDEPAYKYLPELESMDDPRYKDITLRMLLNHSAGLPTNINATQLAVGSLLPDETNLDPLKALQNQALRSNPGEYAVYSNLGFQLAGKILEKLSGQTFSEYLKENFFEPLELKNTYMASALNEDVAADRFALPVDQKGRTLPREYSSRSMEGTGGIVSTMEDLCKFVDRVLSPVTGLLSEESIAEFRKDQSLTAAFPKNQILNALGWDMISRTITGTPVYEKSGGSTHCSTDVVTAPDAGITISVTFQQYVNPFIYNETTNLMRDILKEKEVIEADTDMPDYPAEADAPNESDAAYSGIYNGGDGYLDLGSAYKAEIDGNTMQYSIWNGTEWQDIGEYTRREDGSYGAYEEKGKLYGHHMTSYDKTGKQFTSYSFKRVGDEVYLIKRELTPDYDRTTAIAKLLPAKEISQEAWAQRSNALWLRTNIWPNDYQANASYSTLQTWKELPGYVMMNGLSPLMEIKDDNRISSPTNLPAGSAHQDVTSNGEGISWLGMNFIDAKTVPELPADDTTVTFEKAAAVQWYYVTKDTKINVDAAYDKVRVQAIGPDLAPIYDNLGDSGEFTAPAGSYVGLSSAAPNSIDMGITPVQE